VGILDLSQSSPHYMLNPHQPPPPPPNPKLANLLSISTRDLARLMGKKAKTVVVQPASGATKHRLEKLAGSPSVAERLVIAVRLAYPDKSEQWAYEKAITDLRRDRAG
jgi:hypothetical protein